MSRVGKADHLSAGPDAEGISAARARKNEGKSGTNGTVRQASASTLSPPHQLWFRVYLRPHSTYRCNS